MVIDGVFSGGGMKAIAFAGAIQVLEGRGFRFGDVAGTSAGAIVAALLASGYNSREIRKLLEATEFVNLLDQSRSFVFFPLWKWIKIYWKMGLYSGDALEKWLQKVLLQKGIRTFQDLEPGRLRVIASDLSQGRIVVLPDDLKKYGIFPWKFSVARAVRMSCSLPFFYEPAYLYHRNGRKSVIVDGGVLSNFPLWLFDQKMKHRPVIGFQLSSNRLYHPARRITNALELYQALFATMKEAHDARYVSQQAANDIVFIPVEKVKTTHFSLSDEEKEELIKLGKIRTEKFLLKKSL